MFEEIIFVKPVMSPPKLMHEIGQEILSKINTPRPAPLLEPTDGIVTALKIIASFYPSEKIRSSPEGFVNMAIDIANLGLDSEISAQLLMQQIEAFETEENRRNNIHDDMTSWYEENVDFDDDDWYDDDDEYFQMLED